MSLEIALYAAAIAATLVGIGAVLKALRANRSQDYELLQVHRELERGTGTDSGGGTSTEAEPPTQQTSMIPLAFSVVMAYVQVLYFVLLARSTAAITAARGGIRSVLKALRASRSVHSDAEGGTRDSGILAGDSERGTGTDSERNTGTQDDPPAQQTFVIPLAFCVLLVLYLVLLAHSKPTWQMLMKAGLGLCYILWQSMMAVWKPIKTGRAMVSLMLAMWMLGMPFVQCRWWLFAVSSATCIVSVVVLHYADLGQDIHLYGLAASLIAFWLAALTVLSTWSWASVLLTAPGMIGFYGIPSNLSGLESGPRNVPYRLLLHSQYLIWSMPLPLLTNASWQLLAAVLFAGFGWAAVMFAGFEWIVGPFAAVPFVIGTFLPLAVVWWSGQVPQLFETIPPWMLRLVPATFAAIFIWMEVAYVWVEKENPVNAFGRTEIMTRVLVLLILLATPWALALDTAQLQQWGQIPDFYLPDYLTLQFSENQTWQKVQTWQLPNATWHGPKEYFLHMTRPRWPDLASATNSMARAKFWVLFMTIKLVGTTVFAVLVLGIPCSKVQMQQDEGVGDDRSQNQLKDVQRTSITICLVVANLAFCTKLTLTASMAGQLTSGGMVWEGFDEILSWGLLWLLAQAMALRLLNCNAVYATIDVALSTLFVFPYLGDPFDTLKDAMLASVAIESDVLWLKYLGIAGLIYLWVLHLCVLLPVKSSRLELQSSYVPVLLLKPTRTGSEFEHSMWVKLCIVMYKQTTPTRQKAMLAEDLPQALLAFVVSMSSKGSLFTVVANIAMPLARLSLAVWYHDSLAEAVKDWLLEQAVETFCYDRVEASNEFTVVMSRLAQVTGKDDIWESHLLQEAKDRVNEKWEQVAHMAGEVRSLEEGAAFPAYLQLQLALKGLEQGTTEWQGKALVNLLKMALGDPSWQGICSQVSSGLGPKLTAMEDLKLSRHDFTDEGAQLLADAVSHLTAITKLHLALRYCNITTEGCKAVATGLAKCKNIQDLKLDLQSNTIQGAKALADAITHLTAITKLHLDLNYCKITGEGCKAIATSLAKMTNIQDLKLDLQSNAIRDEGAKALADAISHLTAITKLHLDLWHCNITSDGCKAIATALPKLTNIQELKLDLHGNAIGDEGCRALAEHLPQLQELVMLELYLHGNRLSSAAGAALEEAAAKLPHLTVKTMKWFW